MSERNLRNKTVKGVGWGALDNISNQGITFLIGLVLARLLSPQEYGLIGVITIFISVFNSIVDSGFSNALIRKKEVKSVDYDTVFFVNVGVSVFMFTIMNISAPYIAYFFNQPQLNILTRVMSIIVIINALSIVQLTKLIKSVDFKTQAGISLTASITSGIVGVGMAVSGLGVWSLVGQQISRQGLYTILLWLFGSWRPHLFFSIDSFKEMWKFSWKILCSGILNTVWNELNQIVIGKCYTTSTLGQYSRAQQFAGIFSSNLTSIVQRVSFPVLSSIQDDERRLKMAYRKVIKTTMFVTFTCMLGLVAIAKAIVLLLVGVQWIECVPFLQIICFGMMFYPLSAINLNILQVKGRSDILLGLEIVKKIIYIVPVLLGIFFNIYAMLISSVITGVIAFCLNAKFSGKLIKYTFKEQIMDILPSFLLSLIVGIIVYFISFLGTTPLNTLIIQLSFGLVVFFSICEVIKFEEYLELKTITIKMFKEIKKIK